MADPFLGEIMLAGYDYPPRNWAFADGSILQISQNTQLYSLIGTYYGGNGSSTFGLPNLASQAVCGIGHGPRSPNVLLGATFGELAVALTSHEMPAHNHIPQTAVGRGLTIGSTPTATSAIASANGGNVFTAPPTATQMSSQALTAKGGGQPHDNVQPYLGITYCIALSGQFPTFPPPG